MKIPSPFLKERVRERIIFRTLIPLRSMLLIPKGEGVSINFTMKSPSPFRRGLGRGFY
jgi:hypothetical protein